jgi:hypothetical protein
MRTLAAVLVVLPLVVGVLTFMCVVWWCGGEAGAFLLGWS